MSTVQIERTGRRIAVRSEYRDSAYLKALPGFRWNKDSRYWHGPLSWSSCLALRGTFRDRLEIGPDLTAWASRVRELHIDPMMALRGAEDWQGDEDLRHYQRVGVAFLTGNITQTGVQLPDVLEYDLGGKILGDDMGTGKTVMGARAMRTIFQQLGPDAVFPALIICPNTVKGQPNREKGWYGELERWFPEARVSIIKGTAVQRRKAIEADADIYVINWESVRNHSRLEGYGDIRLAKCVVCDPSGSVRKQESCENCPRELNKFQWRTVIADEAHRQADPTSKQTRAVWSLQHQPSVAWRWSMTGTLADTIDKSWPVTHGIAPTEYPGKTKYLDRYALLSFNAFGGMSVAGIRPETRDEFFAFFDPRYLRRPREYALRDLKDPVRETRVVEMAPKQKKLYNEMAEEMLGRLDDGSLIVAPNPLTLTGRLNQIAASYLRKDDCERCGTTGVKPDSHQSIPHPDPQYAPWYCTCAALLEAPVHKTQCTNCGGHGFIYMPEAPSNKLDALEEELDAIPAHEKVVVFAVSRKLIEVASARLTAKKIPNVIISGGVTESQRYANVEALKTGQARVLFAVIAAAAEGLDGLQEASRTGIFIERDYARRMNSQAEGRLLRSGQEGQVVFIDIQSEGTIELDKEVQLADKADRFEELVRDKDTLRRLLSIRA